MLVSGRLLHSVLRICSESGPWFEWDPQTAAVAAGKIHSVRQFQSFCNTLADQIDRACECKKLLCTSSPVLAPGLPPLDQIQISTVASDTEKGLWQMVWNQLPMGRQPNPTSHPPVVRTLDVGRSGHAVVRHRPSQLGPCRALLRAPRDRRRLLSGQCRLDDRLFVGPPGMGGFEGGSFAPSKSGRRPCCRCVTVFPSRATLLGLGTLAVFSVGQGPSIVDPLYWNHFSTPCQLFVVFGAFSSWVGHRGSRTRTFTISG
jgi:hypothetical protein